MNITEANDVAVLLKALQGLEADKDRIVAACEQLRPRVEKALQTAPPVHEPSVRRAVDRIYGATS